MMKISVIVGSTRQGRFSEKPAQWILQQLQKREGIEAQLLDLRDFPMPFFDQSWTAVSIGSARVDRTSSRENLSSRHILAAYPVFSLWNYCNREGARSREIQKNARG